jgi:DMSO reductase anchor subunit
LVTIYCTAVIYASLKPIPRWHHGLVPPVYLAMGLASGFSVGLAIAAWLTGGVPRPLLLFVLVVIAAAWLLKWRYWQAIETAKPLATTADAIGLPGRGTARLFEAAHTERNYLLDEMGFRIGRKHSAKLRRHAVLLGAIVPALALLIAFATGSGSTARLLLAIGGASALLGILVERWLFFAEAEHTVMLYYGRDAV